MLPVRLAQTTRAPPARAATATSQVDEFSCCLRGQHYHVPGKYLGILGLRHRRWYATHHVRSQRQIHLTAWPESFHSSHEERMQPMLVDSFWRQFNKMSRQC